MLRFKLLNKMESIITLAGLAFNDPLSFFPGLTPAATFISTGLFFVDFAGAPLFTMSAHVFTLGEGFLGVPRIDLLGEDLASSFCRAVGSLGFATLPNMALIATARPGVTLGMGSSKPGVFGMNVGFLLMTLGDAFCLDVLGDMEALLLWDFFPDVCFTCGVVFGLCFGVTFGLDFGVTLGLCFGVTFGKLA